MHTERNEFEVRGIGVREGGCRGKRLGVSGEAYQKSTRLYFFQLSSIIQ